MRKLFENDTLDDEVLTCEIHLYGRILSCVAVDISEESMAVFQDKYKAWCRSPDAEIRELCAYNFPGVLKATGARKYAMHLHSTFTSLVEDEVEEVSEGLTKMMQYFILDLRGTSQLQVRKRIAAGFHEVGRILGNERNVTYLLEPFLRLIQDSREVHETLIKELDYVVSMFAVSNEQHRKDCYNTMLSTLLHVEASSGHNWRLQQAIIKTLPYFADNSSEPIYERLLPVCYKYMHSGVRQVRHAAARLVLIL